MTEAVIVLALAVVLSVGMRTVVTPRVFRKVPGRGSYSVASWVFRIALHTKPVIVSIGASAVMLAVVSTLQLTRPIRRTSDRTSHHASSLTGNHKLGLI